MIWLVATKVQLYAPFSGVLGLTKVGENGSRGGGQISRFWFIRSELMLRCIVFAICTFVLVIFSTGQSGVSDA